MNIIDHTKKFNLALILISFSLQILVLITGLLNYLSFTNTLTKNDNWQSTKPQLFMPASDGNVFASQTQSLANNALDLSAWRAWNEVFLKKNYAWKTLSLQFLPSENSYLYLIFDCTEENFSAIRISYSPLYDSALISAKYTGEFTKIIPLSTIFLNNGWQNLTLKKEQSKSSNIEFWYNNQLIATHTSTNFTEGKIGLRSGKEQILVDNFQITNDQNQVVYSDSFDQFHKFLENFILLLIGLIVFDLICFLIIKVFKTSPKLLIQLNFNICFILLIISVLLLSFSTKIRKRYPSQNSLFNRIKIRNHSQDNSEMNDQESKQIFNRYSIEFDKEKISRIMFIGSSQTFGEGASRENEDFVSQFAKLIKQTESDEGKKFEVINTGIPGLPACELIKYFEDNWIKLKPQWVIVNLAINDEEYGLQFSFEDCLNRLIEISYNQDYSLVFVSESISTEKSTELSTHRLIKEIAKKHGIIFVDMQKYIAQQNNKGIIWWDCAHPTSFGHQLIANYLFESLKPHLFELDSLENYKK